ncbi:MAG: DUF1707 domain-containing protein [Nocardioides sp.]|uniref:DUF1707 SHOCT-like domain-containing protein n=1 Tax=Nocardioides sp. TaxID=35761 RepID=UPI0039E3CB9B
MGDLVPGQPGEPERAGQSGQSGQPAANLRVGDADRNRVAEVLREAAGEGRLDLAELDERLDAVFAAKTYADLVPLTSDLPVTGSTPTPPASAIPAASVNPAERHLAIFGGFERKGGWTVPGELTVLAFCGGADLDLREATFSQRECTFTINAIMGGASVVVPPGVRVIMDGVGILGGYSGPRGPEETGPGSPTLRIKGFAIMGGVDVRRRR